MAESWVILSICYHTTIIDSGLIMKKAYKSLKVKNRQKDMDIILKNLQPIHPKSSSLVFLKAHQPICLPASISLFSLSVNIYCHDVRSWCEDIALEWGNKISQETITLMKTLSILSTD